MAVVTKIHETVSSFYISFSFFLKNIVYTFTITETDREIDLVIKLRNPDFSDRIT